VLDLTELYHERGGEGIAKTINIVAKIEFKQPEHWKEVNHLTMKDEPIPDSVLDTS
jgi:hypothetical protein